MNEKIRELAEQAGPNTEEELNDDRTNIYVIDVEKFAELIVRECAELTLDYKSETYYNGWLDYRDEIKRHFGVEL